ncbi:MAG TPA: hypothetical protein VD736_10340 [Nitrososphaera sp.]|nr:hypothetical protein [Nitrososphaera sp.]
MGERTCRALVGLAAAGIHLDDVTLEKLAARLRNVMGDEVRDLIMQEVFISLDKLYST